MILSWNSSYQRKLEEIQGLSISELTENLENQFIPKNINRRLDKSASHQNNYAKKEPEDKDKKTESSDEETEVKK